MSTTTLIVIVVIAVVIILVLRAKGESTVVPQPLPHYGHSGPPPVKTLDASDIRNIADLIAQGRRVEAIKAYRDATGVSLEKAKNAIEQYDPILGRLGVPTFQDLEDWSEIDALLEAGNKIEAIKLYREKTGCDLKEAKDAIDIRDDVG